MHLSETHELDDELDDELIELERIPCPDGNCIGTIGVDGKCRYCGEMTDGPIPTSSPAVLGDDGDLDVDSDVGPADDSDSHSDDVTSSGDDEDDYWSSRQLCPDGSCIGVIGEDGRCKECGQEADAP